MVYWYQIQVRRIAQYDELNEKSQAIKRHAPPFRTDLANVLYKVVLPALSTSLAATSSPLAMATQVYVHVFSKSEGCLRFFSL